MRVLTYNVGPLDNNMYLVVDEDTREGILIDPSFDSAEVWPDIQSEGWRITEIVNTHAHIDHVVENAFFARVTGAPVSLHADDLALLRAMDTQASWMGLPVPPACEPGRILSAGDRVAAGSETLRVAHTPGHSPGSITLLGPDFAIVGDLLFAGSIGRTDLPGGDFGTLMKSIRRHLLTLPDETVIYPGHGPKTTVGNERTTNPFILEELARDA